MAEFLKEILLNIVLKVGQWLDRKFPDKVTASEVMERFGKFDKDLEATHQAIEALELRIVNEVNLASEIEKLKVDVQKLQALAVLNKRAPSLYQGNMLPPNLGPVNK